MKASQFSDAQIVQILQQAKRNEQTIGAICCTHGIAEATFYRWRKTRNGCSGCGNARNCRCADDHANDDGQSPALPQHATYPNHVWTYDFVKDRCLDGTALRILTVMDECTRGGRL